MVGLSSFFESGFRVFGMNSFYWIGVLESVRRVFF